ncbi:hypothetical protein [Psychrobacter sp. TWR1-1-1]|uniref:hypothetical protein n=1 Tax=unclassified Psychrobacter TaxID=196806 RepID=UPI003CE77376
MKIGIAIPAHTEPMAITGCLITESHEYTVTWAIVSMERSIVVYKPMQQTGLQDL